MTYQKKDINQTPIEFPPNLADKEKLLPNEEKLALLKKIHKETHKMVSIDDINKVKKKTIFSNLLGRLL